MRVKIVLGFFFGLSSTTALGDDLFDIFQIASQNDPTYAAAIQEYNAAKQASPKAWSSALPQLNLQGSHTEVYDESRNGSAGEDYDRDQYALTLTQTIYNKAQFDAISQAGYQVLQAEANYANARHDLIIRVAERYFNILSEQANLVFAKAEKKAIAQQLDQAKQRFNVGLTAITDVHEAQARYDQAVAQEIEAQRLYDISLESLREVTGQVHTTLATVNEQHTFVAPEPNSIDAWVTTALDNNLQLKAAQSNVEIARESKGIANAGHYPTLDLEATYSDSDSSGGQFGAFETDQTSVALVLNIPIFAGGGVNANSREAAALYQQSKELYEQQRRITEREARNSYLTVISSISQVNALKQALISTQTALEATKAGFEVGTRTAVDVLDSQREMYRAQRNYIRARHDYIVNTLRLKQAAGTLVDEDVKLINAWLG